MPLLFPLYMDVPSLFLANRLKKKSQKWFIIMRHNLWIGRNQLVEIGFGKMRPKKFFTPEKMPRKNIFQNSILPIRDKAIEFLSILNKSQYSQVICEKMIHFYDSSLWVIHLRSFFHMAWWHARKPALIAFFTTSHRVEKKPFSFLMNPMSLSYEIKIYYSLVFSGRPGQYPQYFSGRTFPVRDSESESTRSNTVGKKCVFSNKND